MMEKRDAGVENTDEYRKAVDFIFDLRFYCVKEGLKKISRLLELLGDPHSGQRIVRVVGTNGKGSVCAMLSSILTEAGYRVGTNTSPHLVDFTERIRINGVPISREDVVVLVERYRPLVERMENDPTMGCPTYFEVTTAMALDHFRRENVDITILEAGIGGKSDGTNVTESILLVLTRIALDHADKLGDDIIKIIEDKAGAVPLGGRCVSCNPPEVTEVIERVVRERNASLRTVPKEDILITGTGPEGTGFSFASGSMLEKLFVPLPGEFQAENAALAIAAAEELRAEGYRITKDHIRKGLARTKWPGRIEIIGKRPAILVDCAHNPNAAMELRRNLTLFRYDKLHLVFGICEEKDVLGVMNSIVPAADTVIFTRAGVERAVEPARLAEMARRESRLADNLEDAMELALAAASEDDMVLVCGSVYLVGEAMAFCRRDTGND